jgi:WhiB family redox-sensing transcriptional regulator
VNNNVKVAQAAWFRVPSRPDWQTDANCRAPGMLDLMYDPERVDQAKAVCRGCPVIGPCAEWALERQEPFGVWGGSTAAERHALLKKGRRRLSSTVAV